MIKEDYFCLSKLNLKRGKRSLLSQDGKPRNFLFLLSLEIFSISSLVSSKSKISLLAKICSSFLEPGMRIFPFWKCHLKMI